MSELLRAKPTVLDAGPVVHARACPSCGAPVEALDPFCGSCGSPLAPRPEAGDAEASPQSRFFRCDSCGAQVAIDPSQRSYTCPFCDSNYVVEYSADQTGRQAPEFVVGFAVTAEEAMRKFRRWLGRNGWFRPGDLKAAEVAEKLKGVYIPFWSFSMLARSRWSAEIGEHWYRTETYTTMENGKPVTKTRTVTETEWWDLSGRHHHYYSGYLVSGSRGLKQDDAERIKPFHLAAVRRYAPFFLAGWMCEEYSVEREAAVAISRREFERLEWEKIAALLPGDTHRRIEARTEFHKVGSDLVLLPVYVLSYRYRNRLYRFLLNGQTGKAAGNKPVSWWKIGLTAAAAILAVIGVILALH